MNHFTPYSQDVPTAEERNKVYQYLFSHIGKMANERKGLLYTPSPSEVFDLDLKCGQAMPGTSSILHKCSISFSNLKHKKNTNVTFSYIPYFLTRCECRCAVRLHNAGFVTTNNKKILDGRGSLGWACE